MCLVLLLLSSHCYCLIHHRHPLLLDEVCLELPRLIRESFILTSYYDANIYYSNMEKKKRV